MFSQELYLSSYGVRYNEISYMKPKNDDNNNTNGINGIGDAVGLILIIYFIGKLVFGSIAEHAFAVKAMN